MRFIPTWFPGAGFKRQARAWKVRFDTIMDVPFAWAKQQLVSFPLHIIFLRRLLTYIFFHTDDDWFIPLKADGNAVESFVLRFLNREDGTYLDPDDEDVVKWCASGLYSGAADTVSFRSS